MNGCGWAAAVGAGWFVAASALALIVARHLGRREREDREDGS